MQTICSILEKRRKGRCSIDNNLLAHGLGSEIRKRYGQIEPLVILTTS